ncbi:MAG: flagellar basal body protein FliL [Methylococcaceae bacterium]|nr:flagellar basal body protein FliL [Methylococcaceae bacterium]
MRTILLILCFFIPSTLAWSNESKEAEGPVIEYIEFTPKFTVNLAESRKYLMINVQILAEGAETVARIKKHMPALRHELIMLFTGRPADQVQTMEQREALRQETIETLHKTLDKLENSDGFRDVFFTEFLIN